MSRKYAAWFLLAALALGSGCGYARREKQVEEPQVLEEQQGAPYTFLGENRDYRLRTGDQLEVRFVADTELDATVTVRPDGKITLHPIGDFPAAGKTTTELADLVRNGFSRILKDATVTINVRSFSKQYVYVLGEVERPGGVPYDERLTVVRAIALAGGAKISASLGSVVVIEPDAEGKPVGIKVNVKKILEEGDLAGDLEVDGYAVIFVPKSTIGKVDDFVELFFKNIDPALMAVLHGYQISNPEAMIGIPR